MMTIDYSFMLMHRYLRTRYGMAAILRHEAWICRAMNARIARRRSLA